MIRGPNYHQEIETSTFTTDGSDIKVENKNNTATEEDNMSAYDENALAEREDEDMASDNDELPESLDDRNGNDVDPTWQPQQKHKVMLDATAGFKIKKQPKGSSIDNKAKYDKMPRKMKQVYDCQFCDFKCMAYDMSRHLKKGI